MKRLVRLEVGNYTFDPVAHVVTFINVFPTKEQILTVTNVEDGILIYVFADSTLGGDLYDNKLTLDYDTSSMSDTDSLQIYLDIPEPSVGTTVLQEITLNDVNLWQNPSTGELYTQDVNLASVFGVYPIVDSGRLKTKTIYEDKTVVGKMGVIQDCVEIDCSGYPTVGFQITGSWTGTISFEGRIDAGNYVAINAYASNGTVPLASTTANGAFRVNTAGLQKFRLRASAFTGGSGTALATLNASGSPIVANQSAVAGSQAQTLVQRATTYELNTYDTNLAVALGTAALFRLGFTTQDQIVAPTVNPAQPSSYAGPMYSRYPQYLPRLRVEAGGDQKLPLAQEPISNRLIVSTPELYSKMEELLMQTKLQNQILMQIYGITPPNGWEEIK